MFGEKLSMCITLIKIKNETLGPTPDIQRHAVICIFIIIIISHQVGNGKTMINH